MKPKKVKNSKKLEEMTTLDESHNNKVEYLKNKKLELPKIEKNLEELQTQLQKLEDNKSTDQEYPEKKAKLSDKIRKTEKDIDKLKNNEEDFTYYTETCDILMDYYNLLSDNKTIKKSGNVVPLDKILKINPEKKPKEKKSRDKGKSGLYKKYLEKTDKSDFTNNINNNLYFCESCDKEMTLHSSNGKLVCTSCGFVSDVYIDNELTSSKENTVEVNKTGYQPLNHFKDWINQTEGTESATVSVDVYIKIATEIKESKIHAENITPEVMKNILRKLGLTSQNEHVQHLIYTLTGKHPPKFPREIREKFIKMFQEYVPSFERNKPKDRKNKLSYSYVLYKFCELLELDDYLPFFTLLKSRYKLIEQDETWEKICNDLGWQFIPSTD